MRGVDIAVLDYALEIGGGVAGQGTEEGEAVGEGGDVDVGGEGWRGGG